MLTENDNPNISMEPPRRVSFIKLYNLISIFWSGEQKRKRINNIILGFIAFVVFLYVFFWSAPSKFPVGSIYDLKPGQTLSSTTNYLVKANVIKSDFWFKSFVYLFSLGKVIVVEGDYALPKKQNVLSLAWRVSHGELDIVPIKITIPEGINSYEIADILSNNFPSFDKEVFSQLVENQKLEGYLFPDTYFFMPNVKENEVIKIMNDNFNDKINEISEDIKKFGKSQSDAVKMASIIEEEARTMESREIIAGILWKRISIGMALQVDSSFKYINGKTTATLSTEDLNIDSPYNSYTRRGLPPTPISNPGLEAIIATINPRKTAYLYFLTDKDGNMHYASTFDDHVTNKLKYLR
jgi:UPF0755 protein